MAETTPWIGHLPGIHEICSGQAGLPITLSPDTLHTLEPHYSWRSFYTAEEDDRSPFYGREYSEFDFTDALYDHVLHPQWDNFGSQTLYLKLLYADYEGGHAIIELIGEWNDLLYNDIMLLKRDFIDLLIHEGVTRFVLIGENVLNFHASDDEYYSEWFDDIDDGWVIGLNFRKHVMDEMREAQIDWYINMGGQFAEVPWRTFPPDVLCERLDALMLRRLGV